MATPTPIPALAVALGLVLALTGCVPGAVTPTPTSTSSESASPTPDDSAAPTETAGAEEAVTAAVIVVTASGLSVFGTDGSTLVAANYDEDAAGVAAQLAEVLGTEPRVSTSPEATEACPTRTFYDFGGLVLGTPQGLGSPATAGLPGTYDVVVTADSVNGVAVETVAGQRVGATHAAFAAAIGDEAMIEQRGSGEDLGFDIRNPEADEFDHIGTYAAFDGGVLTTLMTPAIVRFVGGCS
jgi:hypothetical protein